MKKNKVIIIIVLIILGLLFFIIFQNNYFKKNGVQEEERYYPPAYQAGDWQDPNIRKIKIEILTEDERAAAGFGSTLADPADVQVISRDEEGNIKSYRKIYKPEDIIDSVYDPDGTKTSGMALE